MELPCLELLADMCLPRLAVGEATGDLNLLKHSSIAPMEDISRKLPERSNCSQGGGIAISGGTMNIISCTINNNQAGEVRAHIP